MKISERFSYGFKTNLIFVKMSSIVVKCAEWGRSKKILDKDMIKVVNILVYDFPVKALI